MKTTTTTNPCEIVLPNWQDDPDLIKWQAKQSEISQKLAETQKQHQALTGEIQQTEQDVVRARSLVILEEGEATQVSVAEARLKDLRERKASMAIEIEALQSARDRAEQETQEAEITAKARAVEVVLPQYREKIYAVQLAFERAIAVNEELEGFETYIARQGLGQEHRAFRQPHHIVGISFPFGLKDWVISTQIVMKQG